MSKIETSVGTFSIDHEIPYVQYVIYAVDDSGETDFQHEIHEFDQEIADSIHGYWNVTYKGEMIETITDSVSYTKVVEYIKYLVGWLETHPDDIVQFIIYESSLAA